MMEGGFSMKIKQLLNGVEVLELKGNEQSEVQVLCLDSRQVIEAAMFFAVRGQHTDGHQYIALAIQKGAVAIVCEELPAEIVKEVCYILVKDTASAMALIAGNFYDNPSHQLKLIGVTGTNGKTTIATLLFQMFGALGCQVGLISTVQNQIMQKVVPSTHTTPDSISLNLLLSQMLAAGCEYVFMEVSSHALVQKRVSGLQFAGAIFSNITHDHLDFHKTFDNYLKAKKSFFDQLPKQAFALTNADDRNGLVMLQNTNALRRTYSLKQMADFKARIIENKFEGLHLEVDGKEVFFKMVGAFNAYNLLAVYATAVLLGQDPLKVLTVLSTLHGAEGRFDYVMARDGRVGIVDYAHTPDAVQNVLSTIANIRKGTEQVITVIGCGGDRDKTKRPLMARVACDWSDKVILTADNPRTENPETILDEMQTGVLPDSQRKTLRISDRKEAIKTACLLAQPGDIILVAGKGHEKYQEINGVRHHFDDKEIIVEQFNLLS